MDDGGKQPHAFGGGQQRAHHPRPFFYVQPPSQPYYLYQHWQLNNPYSHYGLPAGFNLGRPCMHPYQYMQYPGFVFPHAPIYPMDYRRMFDPRFHAPTWGDAPRQQQQQQQQHHHHPQQPHGRRETACSEAQTDPSDAITKLIECLDKIRAGELQGAGEKELDSGVASQSSGMFSPGGEEEEEKKKKKSDEQGHVLPPAPDHSHLASPAATFGDSTAAVYDGESSQRSLGGLSPQGCWPGGLGEELPLDSSSVHEECLEPERAAGGERFLLLLPPPPPPAPPPPPGKEEVADIRSDVLATDPSVAECDAEEPPGSTPLLGDAKGSGGVGEAKAAPGYQILKLPFDSVLTPAAAGASRLPSSSSPTTPYYYNYLSMQTTHERMSVLSPSLDELSSRDEMFSTDLDDVDLFPRRVYAQGRRLAEVAGAAPQAAEEEEAEEEEEGGAVARAAAAAAAGGGCLPGAKRFACACCGKSLAKGAGRSKAHSAKLYREEAGDSEEEEEESRYGRLVARKHPAPRKPHPVPPRHAAKPWYKRGQYRDPSDPFGQEEGRDLCKQEPADVEAGDVTGSELQCRTCQDRLCRDDLTASDQGRWGDADVLPGRRRPATSLQRQEMSAQRKVMYHRPRDEDHDDDDDEPLPLHWERGPTMRGEPR